jgi:hypothetical protein
MTIREKIFAGKKQLKEYQEDQDRTILEETRRKQGVVNLDFQKQVAELEKKRAEAIRKLDEEARNAIATAHEMNKPRFSKVDSKIEEDKKWYEDHITQIFEHIKQILKEKTGEDWFIGDFSNFGLTKSSTQTMGEEDKFHFYRYQELILIKSTKKEQYEEVRNEMVERIKKFLEKQPFTDFPSSKSPIGYKKEYTELEKTLKKDEDLFIYPLKLIGNGIRGINIDTMSYIDAIDEISKTFEIEDELELYIIKLRSDEEKANYQKSKVDDKKIGE